VTAGGICGLGHRMPALGDLLKNAMFGPADISVLRVRASKFEKTVDAEVRAAAPEVRLAAK
jgi:hypothetical protein